LYSPVGGLEVFDMFFFHGLPRASG
jgi:hypothetical protein